MASLAKRVMFAGELMTASTAWKRAGNVEAKNTVTVAVTAHAALLFAFSSLLRPRQPVSPLCNRIPIVHCTVTNEAR